MVGIIWSSVSVPLSRISLAVSNTDVRNQALKLLVIIFAINSSVIRQNSESQNGCFKKSKHANFSKNEHFLPLDTHRYAFLKHPFWDSPFCLITDKLIRKVITDSFRAWYLKAKSHSLVLQKCCIKNLWEDTSLRLYVFHAL